MKATNAQAQLASEALHELARKEMAVGPALKVRKILTEISAQMKDVEDVRIERLRHAAQVDENGQVQANENGEAVFKSDESRADFGTFYRELMAAEQKYTHMLNVADLGNMQVRPGVLIALGPWLADSEAE